MARILGIDPGTRNIGWCSNEKTTGSLKVDSTEAAAQAIMDLVTEHDPDLVAFEDFKHEGFRGRRITTGPEMGRLIGMVEMGCAAAGYRLVKYSAKDTKANMDMLKPRFGNRGHEFSAYCVRHYAEGVERTGGARG